MAKVLIIRDSVDATGERRLDRLVYCIWDCEELYVLLQCVRDSEELYVLLHCVRDSQELCLIAL